MATSRRSSLAEIRLCIFASIFELLPLAHSSERALVLKVRITTQCKQLAYICQERSAKRACPDFPIAAIPARGGQCFSPLSPKPTSSTARDYTLPRQLA